MKTMYVVCVVVGLGACATDRSTDPAIQTAPAQLPKPGSDGGRRVLVDASRDGGV